MRRYNGGSARNGRPGKGGKVAGKVKRRKQAIAVGLSNARRNGKKVPARRGG
jgi:hypothetical protein